MKNICYLFLFFTMVACGQNTTQETKVSPELQAHQTDPTAKGYHKAYFASGCFWCSESIYESILGVTEVISGYSGGTGKNPTYQNYERKGHAEAIEVIYDPRVINFESLVIAYFGSQNVTQQNGQGPDLGSGYRSIIFYQNEEEKEIIERVKAEVQNTYRKPIAAEVLPFQKFWKAEEYHQDYEHKNPNNPYIRNVSLPRLIDFQRKHPELLKENN